MMLVFRAINRVRAVVIFCCLPMCGALLSAHGIRCQFAPAHPSCNCCTFSNVLDIANGSVAETCETARPPPPLPANISCSRTVAVVRGTVLQENRDPQASQHERIRPHSCPVCSIYTQNSAIGGCASGRAVKGACTSLRTKRKVSSRSR